MQNQKVINPRNHKSGRLERIGKVHCNDGKQRFKEMGVEGVKGKVRKSVNFSESATRRIPPVGGQAHKGDALQFIENCFSMKSDLANF